MKVKNFPARKLARQLRAQNKHDSDNTEKLLLQAREIRTKKDRTNKQNKK